MAGTCWKTLKKEKAKIETISGEKGTELSEESVFKPGTTYP